MSLPLRRSSRKKLHIRLTRRGRLALIILLALLVFALFKGLFRQQEAVFPNFIGTAIVHTDLMPKDYAGRTGIMRKIKWIVIHETGNTAASATAANHNSFLHNEKQKDATTAWHYTVDETEIYHHLPDDEVAFHAGDGSAPGGGNICGIGIEICVNDGADYEQAVDHAARLTAYLLDAYHLSLDAVRQHADFMNKDCPERLRQDNRWEDFLQKTAQYKADLP